MQRKGFRIGLIQYDYTQSNYYQYCYIPIFGIPEVQKLTSRVLIFGIQEVKEIDFKNSGFRNTVKIV